MGNYFYNGYQWITKYYFSKHIRANESNCSGSRASQWNVYRDTKKEARSACIPQIYKAVGFWTVYVSDGSQFIGNDASISLTGVIITFAGKCFSLQINVSIYFTLGI
jgi:hypothetical protein